MLCIGYVKSVPDEESAFAEKDPSPVSHLAMRATLSHKGRGKEETSAQCYPKTIARIRRDRLSRSNGLVIISMPACRKPSDIATLSA
jgi:hypothetical protein